jgi:hypothetical protein
VSEPEQSLPFVTRLWFAWLCFFRVLFDGAFATRAWEAREPKALPPAAKEPKLEAPAPEQPAPGTAALQLLAMLQREGRLVDFLEQDIAGFGDAEIGAVARVVHEGCRKTLREHVELASVRKEQEGDPVTLEAGFDPAEVKLSGNVQGQPPYKGVLRHRGWRASDIKLPILVKGHDARVVAPAEVEL